MILTSIRPYPLPLIPGFSSEYRSRMAESVAPYLSADAGSQSARTTGRAMVRPSIRIARAGFCENQVARDVIHPMMEETASLTASSGYLANQTTAFPTAQ